VRQYRNAVTDLVGSFHAPGQWGTQRGLHAQYFKGRRRGGSPAFERTDPQIGFDFGETAPDPKLEAPSFTIRWEGSVLAPETGEYEFTVRTEHTARLWLNDMKTPLIDAGIKSGNDTEYRASISLLGGRAYPLRMEFSKGSVVGDASKKKDTKPEKASIALLWKLPHRAPEVVPQHNLSPNKFSEGFVLTTPFPPDDRSVGYERGTSVSKEWDQATTEAAIEVAGYVVAHLSELADLSGNASERAAKIQEFCRRFAERAFRRPLTDEQKQLYVNRRFEETSDPELAARRAILFVLKSPRFLYREMSGRLDGYDVASRLSFGLWDSLPDQTLYEAARDGKLATPEEVAAQAERMVDDLRTRSKVREFFMQWLRVDLVPDLSKDASKFPEFNDAIASDLRTSLDLFVEDVIWSPASDFRQLLLGDFLYLNGRLAALYGPDLPPDAPFQKILLSPCERAGVLTHPYLMTTFAYTNATSPIHRGVFLVRSVLGKTLRPPPEAVAPLAPDLHPNLTTRERVTLQTSPQACQTCHGVINPLGFTLEHFDALGRYRTEENSRAIDASGNYVARTGQTEKFEGIRALAAFLAKSEETHTAFVEQFFHYIVKQPIRAFGSQLEPGLLQSFAANECSIRKLLVEIVASSALTSPDGPPRSLDDHVGGSQ
jgi:hypothetical protein